MNMRRSAWSGKGGGAQGMRAKARQARGRHPWALLVRWGFGTYGPVRALVFVLAVVAATGFLSAAIISVFIIWLPVALLSVAFGGGRDCRWYCQAGAG